MIRVLIADDHAVVRRGVRQILEETSEFTAAGEATSGQDTLQQVRSGQFDIVLLDISMPDRSGLEILHTLHDLYPRLRVLILSVYPEEQYAVRVLKAGAAGYLTKDSAPEELITALRKVSQGGRYVSAALAEKLAADLVDGPARSGLEALSDREVQVFTLLAGGKTVSEAADEMALSVKTVSTYRTRILQKLDLHSTAELVRYALDHHLIL